MLAERVKDGSLIDVTDGVGEDDLIDVGDAVYEGVIVDAGDDEYVGKDVGFIGLVELVQSTVVTAVRISVTICVAGDGDMSCAAFTIVTLGFGEEFGLLLGSFVTTISAVFVGPSSSTILVVKIDIVAGGGIFPEAVTVSV